MIIIGDVHGCPKTLKALIKKIPRKYKKQGIAICGDLVDRGPDSKGVIQYCIDNDIKCVRGNHDNLMIQFMPSLIKELEKHKTISSNYWFDLGGRATIESYWIKNKTKARLDKRTLNKHIRWLKSLPCYLEFPNITDNHGRKLVVSHSTIEKVWDQRNDPYYEGRFEEYVTWNRAIPPKARGDIFNVFGHTIFGKPIIGGWFAAIDTGCYQKHLGKLTALKFPEMITFEQEYIE